MQHDLAQDGPDNAIKGARGHLSLLASNKLDHGVMVDRNGAAPSSVLMLIETKEREMGLDRQDHRLIDTYTM